jgi:hypothetical protein
MGTVDRDCGAAQPRGGAFAAGAARPWHALTASLSVVVCCFVWLCIRQCHELIFKTRAEQSEGERARAVAGVERAHACVAEAANQARYAFLAPFNPALGLAATLLVMRLDDQPRMPVEAIAAPGDNLAYLFGDTLDLSRLETGRLELEQRADLPDNPVDQTVGMAGLWADQQPAGLWLGSFSSDDGLWQGADGAPAIWLMDDFDARSGSIAGFDPGPVVWQAHGAGDFGGDFTGDAKAEIEWQTGDDAPAPWPGFSLASDNDAGFNPAADWHEIHPYYDLV